MKKRIFTSLLLTGAVFTCSQTVFARPEENNVAVQGIIAELKDNIAQLEAMYKSGVGQDAINADNTVAPLDKEDVAPLASDSVHVEEDAPAAPAIAPAVHKLSKMQEIIKSYMEAPDATTRMVAEKAVRAEFEVDHRNACFETVKYIQDGGKGNEAKFGTLFSLMDMDPRYATKGNKDILKGIQEGVEMREKDARGVYAKKKVVLTAEMLCQK
ncbi:MAG TPA: hypothetical protein DIC42_00340 [Holosporales bacterium]|nr:hypothetical protein [Holosporales bacterium]